MGRGALSIAGHQFSLLSISRREHVRTPTLAVSNCIPDATFSTPARSEERGFPACRELDSSAGIRAAGAGSDRIRPPAGSASPARVRIRRARPPCLDYAGDWVVLLRRSGGDESHGRRSTVFHQVAAGGFGVGYPLERSPGACLLHAAARESDGNALATPLLDAGAGEDQSCFRDGV